MAISPPRQQMSLEIADSAELLIREARHRGRRRRLKRAVILVMSATTVVALVALVAGGIPLGATRTAGGPSAPSTVVNLTAATTSATTNTYLLYAGHGVGVVATYNLKTGCSEVLLSNDFVHWRNVTPPLKRATGEPKGQCLYVWTDASFATPTDGWLLSRNEGSTDTILRHTVDGGKTWAAQPGGDTGSNFGTQTIDFVNAEIGFRQQFGTGSNGNYTLQRTLDGGSSWSTRAPDGNGVCTFAQDVFASASVGFAYSNWTASSNPTFLLRTVNGGVSWSRFTLPVPASLPPTTRGLYGEPEFVGADGVVPVDFPVNGRQDIFFYATHDRGLTWKVIVGSLLPIVVDQPLNVNPQTASQRCDLDARATSGRVPVISESNLSTWWILEPGPKGATKKLMVTDSGSGVSTFEISDLPATTGQIDFTALNARDTLLTLPRPYGHQSTFESTDGGATWKKLVAKA
jgi:photosystem II stability/assembly factor-like uncharacterized protein